MTWDYLFIFILPIGIGSLATVLFTSLGTSMGLVDYPNHRKQHSKPTATTGGLSVFFTLLICGLVLLPKGQDMLLYFACGSLLVSLGLLDDLEDIPALHRLVAQAVIALFMCAQGGIFIENLGDLFGLGSVSLGYWGVLVTVLAVIGAINAFNMIDGIDGLLGSTALIVFSSLSVLFGLAGDINNLQFALVIALSIIPYLWVNLQIRPVWLEKIFMGDTGSMLIGFSVVWFLIQGSQSNVSSFSVATALWLICFPLMDMARVMISRKLQGKSMMEADRTHLHHILSDMLPDKRYSLLVLNLFSLLGAAVGILMELMNVPAAVSFLLFLLSFAVYALSVQKVLERPTLLQG